MSKLSDLFFGSIALKNKVLTAQQLSEALREQTARTYEGRGPTLGEVCRELGYLAQDDVNNILWAQAKSEVLLEKELRAVSRAERPPAPVIMPPARPTIVPPANGWAAAEKRKAEKAPAKKKPAAKKAPAKKNPAVKKSKKKTKKSSR